MTASDSYLQIKGHPVDLNKHIHRIYSDEFKHVVIHYYISARTDNRYKDIRITSAGRKFIEALLRRDVISQWTIFGGSFFISSQSGRCPVSNSKAIQLLCESFCYQKLLSTWENRGYGYLRKVLFMKSVSDSHLLPCGKAVVNHETPLFPPTLYVGKNDRRKCHFPSTS